MLEATRADQQAEKEDLEARKADLKGEGGHNRPAHRGHQGR